MDRVRLIALLFAALGCRHVDGGAVEASWIVVTSDGRAINDCACTCPAIAKMRMEVIAPDGSDACAGRTACEFSCDQRQGATQFDIPPGTYQVRLVPLGPDGTDVSGSEAGACTTEARAFTKLQEVVVGQVTQLDSLEMISGCAPECGGSDNNEVCSWR
jgi:hypothetical protein